MVAGLDFGHAAHVVEEGDQFPAAFGEDHCFGLHGRIVLEQSRVMDPQHAGAGTRRRHHVIEAVEGLDGLGRQIPGRGPVAGIVGRLAAAGLGQGRFDPATGVFEQAHGGETDAGAEQIGQAGDKQADPRALGFGGSGHRPENG